MRRRLVTAALVVALCSVPTPADDAGFAVPPDAVRIDAGELSEPTLSERLAGLLPADDTGPDGALGTAMRRLGAVLRGAEQRRDAAKSRLLSVNRGAYFRGRKSHRSMFRFNFQIATVHSMATVSLAIVNHDRIGQWLS